MEKTITLAMQLYYENKFVTMSFYCKIQDIKEGYMFLSLGSIHQDIAIWKGLTQVLNLLVTKYQSYDLHLAFSPLYTQIGRGEYKDRALSNMGKFKSYTYVPYDMYLLALDQINEMGLQQGIENDTLHGYTTEDYGRRRKALPQKAQQAKKKTPSPSIVYDDAVMPKSGAVLDLETTNKNVEYARCIEVGIVFFEDNNIVGSFHSLANPNMKLPKVIRELTGISQEDVDTASSSIEVIKKTVKLLRNFPYLVGHNISYDYSVIQRYCNRYNIRPLESKLVCTKKLAQKSNIITDNYKLDTLLSIYNIENESPHRALSDATATFRLMNKLYKESFLFH